MKKIIILDIFILLFISCKKNELKKYVYEEIYMSTFFQIIIYSDKNKNEIDRIISKAFEIISNYEENYSVNKTNSIIFKINQNSETFINSETYNIISNCINYSKISEGLFDITIFPLVKLWGFNQQKYNLPDTNLLKIAIKKIGFKNIILKNNKVITKNNAQIDLGGMLKGYVVDRIVEYLKSNNIEIGIVNAGGNLKVFGEKPDKKLWNIGIRHPRVEGELINTIKLRNNLSISTSGDYERYFITNNKRYHHIINPFTGFPVDNSVISVSIIDESAEKADFYSTAIFLMGVNKGIKFANYYKIPAFIVIESNKNIYLTNSIYWINN